MSNSILEKLKITKFNKKAIINSPQEFNDILSEFTGEYDTQINGKYGYIQIFITNQADLLQNGPMLVNAVDGDGYLWVCYPKGTSKKYKKPDCNRDSLREAIIQYGFEGVSLISIDSDWSAMRFRNSDFIGK
jgi:hypothetical protein